MVGAKKRKELGADVCGIFAAPEGRSTLDLASSVAQKWRGKGQEKVACHIEEHIEEFHLPLTPDQGRQLHWKIDYGWSLGFDRFFGAGVERRSLPTSPQPTSLVV
jgi:hypothetical protein